MVVLYFRRDTVKKIRETVPTQWELRYLCLCIRYRSMLLLSRMTSSLPNINLRRVVLALSQVRVRAIDVLSQVTEFCLNNG